MSVGLVLAGGGARGAYEAGVLAELLPWLEERGERPSVLVGTSVGGLTATLLAATAHLPAAEAAEELVSRWGEVRRDRVIRPIVRHQAPRTALRYAAEVAGLPGVRLEALLDPSPLAATVDSWLDWDAVRRNIEDGPVSALAVVATNARTERATAFVQGRAREELYEAALVDYVATPIRLEHVLASAAIPVAFPAHEVHEPPEAAGWYVDGGTRLNTPIKPAIDLGVDRVVTVATHAAFRYPDPRESHPEEPPDFAAGAFELVQATLVDPLINDLRTLGKINLLAERLGEDADPYRVVPYLFAGPRRAGRLARVVEEVYAEHFAGLIEQLRAPDVTLLTRLLGGASHAHAELLSYLFFEPEFLGAAIAAGREDARDLLATGDDPWAVGPYDPPRPDA